MPRIKLMRHQRVGPTRAKQPLFPATVVTTGAAYEVLFRGSIDITGCRVKTKSHLTQDGYS